MKKLTLGIIMSAISVVAFGQESQYQYKVDFFGDTILVDSKDNTIGKQKKDFFGNTIIVDKDGKTIAKQKQDFFGNTILENEAGKTVGTQKKDFFGNKVLESERDQNLVPKPLGGLVPW